MTIKELAEVAGVSPETIRKTAKKLFPEVFKNGLRTNFNEAKSLEIMKTVSKKNMVSPTQTKEVATQTKEVDQQTALIQIMESQQKFMIAVLDKLDKIGNQQSLQIEAPREDYFSLVGYTSLNGIKTNRSELAMHGMTLKKMAKLNNFTVRQIPDERWGKVNSYPVELLDEYFNV